ncbi:iron ABC transporter permease [Porphyromonas sp. COT-239 OH1446]|uniref:FecCD family ABC transporter permease n=1 Tax=Porphyromonas sp. COT-239 OH1446 TaxID=1515613 RepID=UPI00052D0779|nr:iron ABC transporter permease [Porphyromonas sp. COT-239 OH1446]KGN71244.1 iron ABC transporter [Porphyromonas sp. COT-239 OH1446]
MNLRITLLFFLISLGILLAFSIDIMWGKISVPASEVWASLLGRAEDDTFGYVIQNFRLPKALTALFAGAGIATAGLQMQSLFRNPLADTSILGINSGAGVGVAIYTMAFTIFPSMLGSAGVINNWGVIISACLGSMAVLLMISIVASRLHDIVSVLIVGVMVGFLASSIISILQFFSDEETLKTYLLWSFGSVSGTTWRQLSLMLPVVGVGLFLSLLMPKQMNALALGENYARSVGTNVRLVRIALVCITSLITGCITAFTGPIAFLGMAVPHFARMAFGTADHRILIPATMLSGSLLLLLCDIFTQMPGQQFVLPINAITSLIGAPVVILVVMNSRSKRQIFGS